MAARGLRPAGGRQEFGPLEILSGLGDGDVDLGGLPHPETRHFQHGGALLGYLEGRPGVTALREVEGWKPEGWTPAASPPEPSAEVLDRVMGLPLVRDAGSPEDRAELLEAILAAWAECEDGGAWVTVDVDSDSP
jgi:hypothetical protein